MTQMHEVDYKIFGDDMQFVEVELDPGESAVAEAGAMMYMTDGIELNTRGSVSGAFRLEGAAADGNADITVSLSTVPPTTTVWPLRNPPWKRVIRREKIGTISLILTQKQPISSRAPLASIRPASRSAW